MGYKIQWEAYNAIITFPENVDFETIETINNFFLTLPNYSEMKYQLWDFGATERIMMDAIDTEKISDFDKRSTEYNDNLRIAFVSKADQVTELCSDYIDNMKGTPWSFAIFDTSKKALDWCNE